MRQTLLTRLRATEGRPLAAAVACLLLLAALIGGVHTGAMAAVENAGRAAFVLCSHDANGNQPQPADPRADLCCVVGCLAHAPALAAAPPLTPEPRLSGSVAAATMPAVVVARGGTHPDHRPRGPPSLA